MISSLSLRVRRAAFAVIAGLLLTDSASAQTVLRWKFQPGQLLHYRMEQLMKQELMIPDAPAMPFSTKQTMDMQWKVDAVHDDETVTVVQTVTRLQMKIESPQGVLLDYDSAAVEETGELGKIVIPLLESLLNRPMQATYTSRGEVREMKLPNGLLEKINQIAGGGQFGKLFSEEGIKQLGNLSILPEDPVTKGQTWQSEAAVSNAILGGMKLVTTCRYEGTVEQDGRDLEKISTTLRFQPAEEKPSGIVSIEDQSGDGTIYFDAQAGRLQQSQSHTKMKMNISILGRKMLQQMDIDVVMKLQSVEEASSASPASDQP